MDTDEVYAKVGGQEVTVKGIVGILLLAALGSSGLTAFYLLRAIERLEDRLATAAQARAALTNGYVTAMMTYWTEENRQRHDEHRELAAWCRGTQLLPPLGGRRLKAPDPE